MEATTKNYYESELSKVNVGQTEFAPTVKIFANGNGENTKHISLNEESARILIHWLSENFFHVATPPNK